MLLYLQLEVGDVVMARLAVACTGLVRLRLEQTYVGDRGVAAIVQHCPLLEELRVLGEQTHEPCHIAAHVNARLPAWPLQPWLSSSCKPTLLLQAVGTLCP